MVVEKAVVLARGLGTRMRKDDANVVLNEEQRKIAEKGIKALIPVAGGRPFLDYVLSALADAGISKVCLVVAPEHEELRSRYSRDISLKRLSITYAIQEKPLGTANAVAAAEDFVGTDSFLMVNSDNYYPHEALTALRELPGSGVALFEQNVMLTESNIAPERILAFAVGLLNGEGYLVKILEKPTQAALAKLPRPLWLSMNCWRFSPNIFEACRRIGPSPRGEYEITDAVQFAIDHLHEQFHAVRVPKPVYDMTSRADIPSIAARLAGIPVHL
ncbi:MAG: nucleotidyltransferase family protein [Thermogutta sp.]